MNELLDILARAYLLYKHGHTNCASIKLEIIARLACMDETQFKEFVETLLNNHGGDGEG